MQPEFQMDSAKLGQFVNDKWDSEIVPQLVDYIRIPNKSPMFDPQWHTNTPTLGSSSEVSRSGG